MWCKVMFLRPIFASEWLLLFIYTAPSRWRVPLSTRHVNLMKKLTLIQQRDTDSTEACLVVCIRRHTRSPEAPAEVRSKKGVGGVDLFLVGITSTFTFTQRDAHAWAKPLHIPNVSKQRTNTSVESHFIFSRFWHENNSGTSGDSRGVGVQGALTRSLFSHIHLFFLSHPTARAAVITAG